MTVNNKTSIPKRSANRVRLAKIDMKSASSIMDKMAKRIHLELSGRTSDEIYELCFSRLLTPDPVEFIANVADRPMGRVLMMGTDQRDLFARLLQKEASYLQDGSTVADLGCGDGQTSRLLWDAVTTNLTLDYLDPNQSYLSAYGKITTDYPLIRSAKSTKGTLDDWVSRPTRPVNRFIEGYHLILMVHSLYFTEDLNSLMNRLIEDLAPSGRLFIVFADELSGYTGKSVLSHLRNFDLIQAAEYEERVRDRHTFFGITRRSSLGVGLNITHLRRHINRNDFELSHFEFQPSRIYAHAISDLYAAAFITGLATIGSQIIGDQIEDVKLLLKNEPGSVDLSIESKGVRRRMFSVSQPQFVLILRKRK